MSEPADRHELHAAPPAFDVRVHRGRPELDAWDDADLRPDHPVIALFLADPTVAEITLWHPGCQPDDDATVVVYQRVDRHVEDFGTGDELSNLLIWAAALAARNANGSYADVVHAVQTVATDAQIPGLADAVVHEVVSEQINSFLHPLG